MGTRGHLRTLELGPGGPQCHTEKDNSGDRTRSFVVYPKSHYFRQVFTPTQWKKYWCHHIIGELTEAPVSSLTCPMFQSCSVAEAGMPRSACSEVSALIQVPACAGLQLVGPGSASPTEFLTHSFVLYEKHQLWAENHQDAPWDFESDPMGCLIQSPLSNDRGVEVQRS